jgi:hypothetical protein
VGESGSSATLSGGEENPAAVPRLHTRWTGTHRMCAKLTLHDAAAVPTERRPPCRKLRRLRRAKPKPPEERPLPLPHRQPQRPRTAPAPNARGYPHATAARCADSSANRSPRREVVRGVKRPESFAARPPPSGKRRRRGVESASKRQSECYSLTSYSLKAGLTLYTSSRQSNFRSGRSRRSRFHGRFQHALAPFAESFASLQRHGRPFHVSDR